MPEWLFEEGIGERRYALVDNDEIAEARIEPEGTLRAGSVIAARLVRGGRNAIARDESGNEYLVPKGAPGVTEGATLAIEITREAIPGTEPWKRPLARMTDEPAREAPRLEGRAAQPGELGGAGWDELIEEARSGVVPFNGGELRISPTPAMTLIDVDGALPPDELAVRGAAEAARAIRRFDIGGSIGIDLPTAGSKAVRQHAAEAIDATLPQPFERTAVNGFGFVQIVRVRQRASLVELAQDRAAFEARALLRRAAFEPPGPKRLVAHPAVVAMLEARTDWLATLSRLVGGTVGLRADPALPMSGGYAESA
ncbi:MAG TPA: ribonuclease [Sphingomicrobium sp.]|nr:ribonuclease [Sphingomicrobium sp.]